MTRRTLASLGLIDTSNKPERFARKVIVISYVLETDQDGQVTPKFLLSVISPKQKAKTYKHWKTAKQFKLPSGYSLVKGTREMIYAGERLDVPPGFSRYFQPKTWDKKFLVDSEHQAIIAKLDGVMPAVSTALTEAREEAGIGMKNIKQLFDLGVHSLKMDGRLGNYHCFAMELHQRQNKVAMDSLALNYFSYAELKQSKEVRFRYNIPLVRPSHFRLIKKMRKPLKNIYRIQGIKLSIKKSVTGDWVEKQMALIKDFRKLLNNASKGKFITPGSTSKATRKHIIKRSKHSKTKLKRIKQLRK